VYGRDVERLTLNRKLAGYKRPATVRVIAVDASSPKRGKARQVEGRYPPEDKKKARLHRVAPGGAKGEEEFYPVQVHGITDPDQLNRIAQSIYEEIGRGEIGGTIETPNLASFGGDNADPDLLKLKPGDAIELMADTRAVKTSPPLQSSFTESLRRGFDAQVKEVAGKLGDENLARVVVATARGEVQELQRAFRVSAVHYSWDHDSGIKVSFDVQNYVEVRADVGSTAQAKLSTAAKNPLTAAISTATGSSA
jgi:hypothetical protein